MITAADVVDARTAEVDSSLPTGILLERADGTLADWVATHVITTAEIAALARCARRAARAARPGHRPSRPQAGEHDVHGEQRRSAVLEARRLRNRQVHAPLDDTVHLPRPGYMAPEQRSLAEARPSADRNSFGKLVCWLLTGGTDPDAIIAPHGHDLVDACVADDPDDRPDVSAYESSTKCRCNGPPAWWGRPAPFRRGGEPPRMR